MRVIGTPPECLIPSVSVHWLLRETECWSPDISLVSTSKAKPIGQNWARWSPSESTRFLNICLHTSEKRVLSNLHWHMYGEVWCQMVADAWVESCQLALWDSAGTEWKGDLCFQFRASTTSAAMWLGLCSDGSTSKRFEKKSAGFFALTCLILP